MEIILAVAVIALLWDNVMRIPQLRQAITDLKEEKESLQSDLADQSERLERVELEAAAYYDELSRLKDPEYYSALAAGDGHALYELDKRRGNI